MLGLWLAVGAVSASAVAGPTPEDKAGARAAAESGAAAFKDGRYKEALDRFRRAEALIHAPTHLLMTARTYVALGELVRARETYRTIVRERLAPSAPEAFKRAQAAAEQESQELEPRIAEVKVSIDGPSPRDKLVVTMDGEPIAAALVGIQHPIDPGSHAFAATATGLVAPAQTVQIEEGGRVAVVLELSPVEPTPAPVHADAADAASTERSGSSALRTTSYVLFGTGVAGLAFGAVFGGLALSEQSDSDDAYTRCSPKCTPSQTQEILALDRSASDKGTIGVIGLAAGGTLAVGGAILYLVSRPKAAPTAPAEARLTPWIGVGQVGVSGRF
jgi:hypothetical protein